MQKQRDGIDISKIILSFLIVALHSELLNGKLFPYVRIAVPVFFVFSGFLFFEKIKISSDGGNCLKNMIRRNLQLYIFWFVVLIPFTLYARNYFADGIGRGILYLIRDFIFGSTFRASWYIIASTIGMSIIYFLGKRINNTLLLVCCIPFFVLACLSTNYYFILEKNEIVIWWYQKIIELIGEPHHNFMISLIYVTIGKIISEMEIKNQRYRLSMLGILIIGLVAEYNWLNKYEDIIINNDCYLLLVPIATYFVLWIKDVEISIPYAKSLRNVSTIVYCIHCNVIMVVGKLIRTFGIVDKYHILLFIISLLISIFFAVLILLGRRKIIILRYAY